MSALSNAFKRASGVPEKDIKNDSKPGHYVNQNDAEKVKQYHKAKQEKKGK